MQVRLLPSVQKRKVMTTKRKPFYNYSPVDSSFIRSVSWYEDSEILMIHFASGSAWLYYDVPFEVFAGLMKAPSHGKYFNNNIRNIYSSQKAASPIPQVSLA